MSFRLRALLGLAATALLLGLAAAGPAMARDRLITVQTPPAPGPAALQPGHRPPVRAEVGEAGPRPDARDAGRCRRFHPGCPLSRQARPGLQVWAIDRRTQALEDTATFAAAEAGQIPPQQAFDYYLNGGGFHFRGASQDPYAREWGMAVALDDARAVVLRARAHGRRQVVLGGHSLGASLTVAYAAWDFNGRPGYKDLAGLVLIDGGLLGSFDAYDLAQSQQAVADLQTSDPFLDLLGVGLPEAAGLFAEIGGLYAEQAPTASATTLQSYPLLPAEFNPPVPGDESCPPRLRLRPRHLAGRARTAAHQRRRPGGVRRPAGLGRRRRHAGEPAGGDLRAGAEQRGRVVLPEAAHDRHQRRRPDDRERRRPTSSACASSTRGRSTCRCTRSPPTWPAPTCSTGPATSSAWRGPPRRQSIWSTATRRSATSTRSPRRRRPTRS